MAPPFGADGREKLRPSVLPRGAQSLARFDAAPRLGRSARLVQAALDEGTAARALPSESPSRWLNREWHRLEGELRTPDGKPAADTPDAMHDQLMRLGFTPETTGEGGRYRREGFEVRVSSTEIAGQAGVKVEVLSPKRSRFTNTLGAAYLSGLEFPRSYWRIQENERDRVLAFWGSQEKDPTAIETRKDLLAALEKGRNPKNQLSRASREAERQAEIGRLRDTLAALTAQGLAPRNVLVYTEGPDAAGKTSTGELLRPSFEALGYETREHAFKAPTPEERDEHWLARFRRQAPSGPNQLVRWDRGPAGNAAYQPQTEASLVQMAGDFKDLQLELRENQGTLWLGYFLFRDPSEQARTFGKREARSRIAREIQDARHRAGLDPAPELDQVIKGIGLPDLKAARRFREVQSGFLKFVDETNDVTPWNIVDTSDRQSARIGVVRDARERLLEHAVELAKRTGRPAPELPPSLLGSVDSESDG